MCPKLDQWLVSNGAQHLQCSTALLSSLLLLIIVVTTVFLLVIVVDIVAVEIGLLDISGNRVDKRKDVVAEGRCNVRKISLSLIHSFGFTE